MERASVRDLRYAFPKVEAALSAGEAIQIVKRNKVIATLVPVQKAPEVPVTAPDFLARLSANWGNTLLDPTNAELLAAERDRF